ncbi:hypothetical protein RFI_05462 [Reticulomyxa filosa]|uniref:Uncharacterized protein n=1 Tax=Reticulomyxa filosa TaxID=46433 RepID=X6P0J7_RETFI|nr:hypothetical protein RFI_05462 [Reticulomyxa filosa]|eukprot:ETO31658.1 hypothetical protein RFI_05462 [Reticulomyxa filosa]
MRHSESNQVKAVLLLDEIGLAEHSKHSPLKILHQLLEDPKISFVGISNWPLDAAKMNRVIMHQILPMTTKELKNTALKMMEHHQKSTKSDEIDLRNDWIGNEIENIAKVYDGLIEMAGKFEPMNKKHFFGARDFFSDDQIKNLSGIFCDVLKMKEEEAVKKMSEFTPMECVRMNLSDITISSSKSLVDNYNVSRHCMVISESEYSWQLLLENEILKYDDVFLFKSGFAYDQSSSIADFEHLNKVISCMSAGKKVVLYKLDSIYESLYDMLNQRYQKKPSGKNTSKKKKRENMCCRVALGSESKDCFVKEEFKCIVIINKDTAYSPEMPIAFLSRFEKQLISYRTSLPCEMESWISPIKDMLTQIFCVHQKRLKKLFFGFNDDTVPSALSNISIQKKEDQELPDTNDPYKEKELVLDEEKFDYKKAGQKEFPSFEKVIESQHNAKKIEAFKTSRDFELAIHHFFSPDNTFQNVQILQYMHDSKNLGHFTHIKHTLEHAHYRYYCRDKEEKTEEEVKDDQKNENEQKLIVLLVHMKQPIFKDPFPLIFSRKWKLTYVDSLSSIESVQVETLLSQTISDVLERGLSNKQLRNAIQRAFARLHNPAQKDGVGNIQKLLTLFEESTHMEECRREIVSRLKELFKEKGIVSEPIACILNKEEIKSPSMLSLGYSFFERYENIVDRLLVMACMNILSVFYENCYFQIFFDAVEKNLQHLATLFMEVAKDMSMVTIPRLTGVIQRLVTIEPDLRAVSIQYKAMFPWSHILHNWCHSNLVNIDTQNCQIEKPSACVNEDENEKENENESKYGYQGANKNETKTILLDNHRRIIQSSKLFGIVMGGRGSVSRLLNKCDIECCRMYLMDVITAKYHLYDHCKVAIVTDVMFCMMSMYDWSVSIAMIESILYFLPDIFAKYVDLLKGCQENDGIISELYTLLKNEKKSTRLSDSICLLLKHFISFSPEIFQALYLFSFVYVTYIIFAENDWFDIARNLEAVKSVVPTILQFAKDWYGDGDEYKSIISMCRQAHLHILGAKHFERQIVDRVELNKRLSHIITLSENGWLNDNTTIPSILNCMLEGENLALDKRPHFIRDVLTTVKQIETLDTLEKQNVYRSVITELFHNAQALTSGTRNETDKIRLQILEELIQHQWNEATFALNSHEAALLNRVLERMYIHTSHPQSNGPNQVIVNISNLKVKLFQFINSILSITEGLQ